MRLVGCVQPLILTQMLEYSNLLFTVLFAVEMMLKLTADGLVGYIRDGFNVFDGFIVILRYGPYTTPPHQYSTPKPFTCVTASDVSYATSCLSMRNAGQPRRP